MVTVHVEYTGDLHCSIRHGPSGAVIATDAPPDNQGKGEAFSPTDLVAASLGSCMATIMGIVARRHEIDLRGMKITVEKEMVQSPVRRIGRLAVRIALPPGLAPEQRETMRHAAGACPVHKSLSPDVRVEVHWVHPAKVGKSWLQGETAR